MSSTEQFYQIPGPQGTAGADGADGADGSNGYAVTTAQFTMPAEGADVTVAVDDSSFASVGQVVHVTGAGHFEVASKPSSTQITLTNLEDTATSAYTDNVAPATVVATAKRVAPAGLQGPAGADGTSGADADAYYVVGQATDAPTNAIDLGAGGDGTFWIKNTVASNVATLTMESAATTRTNLGLDDMATQNSASVAITGGAIAGITDLAVADGGTGSSNPANARSALSAAESGANTDITSLAGLTTALSVAQGGTGVDALPAFSVNLGGSDQTSIAASTPTKIAFNTEVFDNNSDFDTAQYRFTPTVAGYYVFHASVMVNSISTGGKVVTVYLYKNGTDIAHYMHESQGSEDLPSQLTFLAEANGSTDYFEIWFQHDDVASRDVEGDEETTYFCGHWAGGS